MCRHAVGEKPEIGRRCRERHEASGETLVQRLATQDLEEPFGRTKASSRFRLLGEASDYLIVEKSSENPDVRSILRRIHSQLVSKQIEWVGDQNGKIGPARKVELARGSCCDVGRGQPRTRREQINFVAPPLGDGDRDGARLRHLGHAEPNSGRVGDYALERPARDEQVEIAGQNALAEEAGVRSHGAATNDDKLRPNPASAPNRST
jgi:hypothetical protein